MKSQRSSGCCLTIAGSDSGGNAGVQADLRTFHAYRRHGCTVFTAMTAQNPFGVAAIHPLPAGFVAAQLDAVLDVYDILALKTGMLADAEIIETVADRLRSHRGIAKVIDPVMVATSGAKLIADDAVETLKTRLLPLATLMTPNLPEAEALCGRRIEPNRQRTGDARHAAELARELFDRFGCAVLVKGGHGANTSAVDVLFDGRDASEFSMAWIADPVSTHGTGCSLAAALTAELSLGHDLATSVAGAKAYVHDAIAGSFSVGDGCGVLGFAPNRG